MDTVAVVYSLHELASASGLLAQPTVTQAPSTATAGCPLSYGSVLACAFSLSIYLIYFYLFLL